MYMHSRRCCAVFLLAASVVGPASRREAQAQQPTLPSNWQGLAPTDFAKAVAPFYDIDAESLFVTTINDDAVREQAAALVATIDFSSSQLGYPVLNFLHMLANPKLADSDQGRIKNGLLARQDDWTGRPYSDFDAKWNLMYRLKLPAQLRLQEGTRWAQAGGQFSAIPARNMPEAYLYFAPAPPRQIDGSFSVQWQGQLIPPQSGDYTFSVSPINVNSQAGSDPVQVAVSISVAGNSVLTANSKHWTLASSQINLTSGQPTPLSVAWSAQVGRSMPPHTLHALLSWQGPGMANSIVPSTALMLPDGSAHGLQVTYTWTSSRGQQQTLTRVEPNLDALWTSPPIWLLADASATAQAGALLIQKLVATDYVSQYASLSAPVKLRQLYSPFFDPDATAQILSSSQRNTLLSLIQSQPALLDPVDPKEFVAFFGDFRMGNPDAALQLTGIWATRHGDIVCKPPSRGPFEFNSRGAYRRLALYTTQQMPQQVAALENDFLVTADGRCCLPVAYTLAYSYLGRNKLGTWAQALDTRLRDANLTGDLRVNWVLARAFVEEIRHVSSVKHGPPDLSLSIETSAHVMDGKDFLNQAIQAAQSPAVKVRASLELAGRLASTGQFDAAIGVLQPLTNSAPPDQQVVLTYWLNSIAALKSAQAVSPTGQNAAARQAYLNSLRQRRDQAAARGDTAAVNRYNAMINALSN
jgi:PA14 domain